MRKVLTCGRERDVCNWGVETNTVRKRSVILYNVQLYLDNNVRCKACAGIIGRAGTRRVGDRGNTRVRSCRTDDWRPRRPRFGWPSASPPPPPVVAAPETAAAAVRSQSRRETKGNYYHVRCVMRIRYNIACTALYLRRFDTKSCRIHGRKYTRVYITRTRA